MLLQIAAAVLIGGGVFAQDGLLGSNPCTYAPNSTCYPNPVEPGRPLCCTIDPSGQSCKSAGEPCFNATDIPSDFNISDFNLSDTSFELGIGPVIGGDALGSSICTYSPNTTCFPNTNGFPPCCEDSTCTSEYPPCEEKLVIGGDICTYSPDTDCWPSTNGWPPCCSAPSSSCPSSSEYVVNVNPPCENPQSIPILGSNVCTYAPDKECYPSTNGWPKCCEEDPDSCTKHEPCENDEILPTKVDEVLQDPSSSTVMCHSLFALAFAHALACVTSIW